MSESSSSSESTSQTKTEATITYWAMLREWLTVWYALAAELLLSRGDAIACFRRGDYGGFLGNVIVVVLLYMPVITLLRYLYAKRTKNSL